MLKRTAIALALGLGGAFALGGPAQAQSSDALKKEIDELKARIQQLEEKAKALDDAGGPIDREEFNRVKTKAEALEDQKETAGFKGFRISGGIDPTYIYNKAKGSSSFAFLNNFTGINGSGEVYSYDNGYAGLAYIDFQKEMDEGAKFRLTLMPHKSAGSQYNWGSIVHEASASIPLTDAQTRLLVGQIPDVSGYEGYYDTYNGQNAISSNVLYPSYARYTITHNLLFDFAAATFYTGLGLDLTRGPWETRFFLANFNSTRNDINTCTATPCTPRPSLSPVFVYNAIYAKEEFWGWEFTGYEGRVPNFVLGGSSRLDQFEFDANYTRGLYNANIEVLMGRQKAAAIGNLATGGDASSQWYGISLLSSQYFTPKVGASLRFDYINNHKNGGGTFNVGNLLPAALNGTAAIGDFYNGFGPGDPNAAGYDPNSGANRYSLTLAGNYRMTRNVLLRAEFRHDHASKASFYDFQKGTFSNSNELFGLETVVNF